MSNNEKFKDEIAQNLDHLRKSLLYLLYSQNKAPIRGRTMLQKEMFLVANFIQDLWISANFVPYNHGAYSEDVEVSLDELKSYGLVKEEDNKIYLSDFGEDVLKKVISSLSHEETKSIDEFKEFMNNMTLREALVYHYFTFKFFAKDSAMIKDIVASRLIATISLYRKGLINLEKAMSLSGLSGKKFLELINKK